jgi:hypothetical protein
MLTLAAQFAGATAVQVFVYDKPFAVATVTSMGGPLGIAVGGLAATAAAIASGVVLGADGTLDGKDLFVMAAVLLAGPLVFVHYVGGTPYMEAIAMTVGGAAAAALVSSL